MTQQEQTKSKLTPQESAQEDAEQEQQTTKMSQPIRIIITPTGVAKPTTPERRKARPDTSRLLVPIRKKPTKRARKREEEPEQQTAPKKCTQK